MRQPIQHTDDASGEKHLCHAPKQIFPSREDNRILIPEDQFLIDQVIERSGKNLGDTSRNHDIGNRKTGFCQQKHDLENREIDQAAAQ